MANQTPPGKDQPPKNKIPVKTPKGSSLLVWLIVILAVVAFFQLFSGGEGKSSEPSVSQFLQEVESGKVNKIIFSGKDITYFIGTAKKMTNIPYDDPDLVKY
ncbi:MAG TPA: cell division protein FtsH, partial [Candidatus Cloacimonetes bacterium]|nr:cell division protein FtsH [Candidatus Cloacimonadota bacterium]